MELVLVEASDERPLHRPGLAVMLGRMPGSAPLDGARAAWPLEGSGTQCLAGRPSRTGHRRDRVPRGCLGRDAAAVAA
jgi:hypothetical protein